jgi:16S rRNA (guanine966-N2)-methyltransferase
LSRSPPNKKPAGIRLKRRETTAPEDGDEPLRSLPTHGARAIPGRQRLRITGGMMRSRQVHFPAAPGLRPTPDRVRETLFNWLGQDLSGWRVLDLFAGSGILGMEALSRGAAWLGVVEQSARVAGEIRRNMAELAVPPERVHIWRADATVWLKQSDLTLGLIDLVFLDPPFARPDLLQAVLSRLNEVDWLAPHARMYVEQSAGLPSIKLPGWTIVRQGQAGESLFMLWERAAKPSAT